MAIHEEMLGPEAHCWQVGSFLSASVDGTWKMVWRVEKRQCLLELVLEYSSQLEVTLWPGRIQNFKKRNII